MKKKYLILLYFLYTTVVVYAQPFGNEWIDYSKTYYKFKIANTGLCRITNSALQNAGIPTNLLIGADFKVYKNGQEIPIFVTTNSAFSNADFIEFYGEKNDGKTDSLLYATAADQPHTYKSLITDSTTYFLTTNPFTINARIGQYNNDLSNAPPKTEYCIYKSVYAANSFLYGRNPSNDPRLQYSHYNVGAGFSDNFVTAFAVNMPVNFAYLGVAPPINVKSNFTVKSNGAYSVITQIGAYTKVNTGFGHQTIKETHTNININTISSNLLNISYTFTPNNNQSISNSAIEVFYPRQFNFENNSKFNFALDNIDNNYIEIKNFNRKSTLPILYDLANNQRFIGIVDTVIKFNLPNTNTQRNLFLSSQDISDITFITNFSVVNFKNFSNNLEQGNFIILTHKSLKNSSDGVDYVNAYNDYRTSPQGGSFISKMVDIEEITDQFYYGIKNHPLVVRNFINYALANFTTKPEQLFIVGRGYASSRFTNAAYYNATLIPTYGYLPSDNLLVSKSGANLAPQIGVGRLDVTSGNQVKDYLNKVIEYEAALNDTSVFSQTPFNKMWMKNVLHLAGGNNEFEQEVFASFLNEYKGIIEAPKYAGKVSSLYKNTTNPVQIADNIFIDSLINKGVSLITFFGHSATSALDYNLTPENFNNRGKYHLMLSNGCFVGSIFDGGNSYSDRFVLTPNKAGIGYLAPVTYADAISLYTYSKGFYNRFSNTLYNNRIGNILKESSKQLIENIVANSLEPVIGEQMIFHGDPALKINFHNKPDYYIDETSISFEPQNINASLDSFLVKIVVKNLGAATNSNYTVNINRILPNGEIRNYSTIVPSAIHTDTVYIWIQPDRLYGAGINTFTIKIDYEDEIDEYVESNNIVTVTKNILADDIIPIFPYQFCIVNMPNIDLTYSIVNPFGAAKSYILQLDTTELFNSPILIETKVIQAGGTIKWNTGVPFLENKVYYWRGSLDTIYGNTLNWNNSSFLYNTALPTGWNQSHYYQYLKDRFFTLELPNDRIFKYPNSSKTVRIINGQIADQSIEFYVDGFVEQRNSYARSSFIFYVFDVNTGKPWETYQIGNTARGPYGDFIFSGNRNVIEFATGNATIGAEQRTKAIAFLNSIPSNAIVFGYSFYNAGYNSWNDSLLTAFENLGVTQIRNQIQNVAFCFFLQKGNAGFPVSQIQTFPPNVIDTTFTFSGNFNKGVLASTIIGPAKKWDNLLFDWHALENPNADNANVNVYGIDTLGSKILLYNQLPKINTPLIIDAKKYPFLQLELRTEDAQASTAPQLDYWRVHYAKPPEAVVNPAIFLSQNLDTLFAGQTLNYSVAVENVSPINMDSLLVKYTIINENGSVKIIYTRYAPLPANQHIVINFAYDFLVSGFYGKNTIIAEVNPNDDQVEQYHFNNFATFFVFVEKDKINPILDVTFDGRHIIDNEYVAQKPEILFRLKDENKYLALNDTAGFLFYLYYPNAPNTPVLIDKNSPDIIFIPANSSTLSQKNEAKIYFKPTLADGKYELKAQGIDRSSNEAGKYDYRIRFIVDSKPSITNVLNYPNPFSTQTQFVFTLTGAEVPTNIKIQIFSVTGKIVKEITREELGNLHIGTNITEYKWNATDDFGDRLANGVYFYRVITKNNDGSNTEIKESGADKFFKNGYGKLYIIR